MSPELRITPVVAGANVTLLVKGAGLPAVGKEVNRAVLKPDDQVLEDFRRGTINAATLQTLSDQITDWLLGADLRPVLEKALPANGGALRVVVEVPDGAREVFSQLPFELVWHDTPDKPLVLRKDVQSLVYVLSKMQQAAAARAVQPLPYKILIVRAFPQDYDPVPEVKPLVDQILTAAKPYGQGSVQVDVLSREAAIDQPATWQAMREKLQERKDHNMLVFVGHGELVPAVSGGEPIGELFLEAEDGGAEPVTAAQLARLLSDCPVDVVVLAGCLTGADPAGTPRRRGAAQGVAQALVNSSEAGVEVAVAMRTELQTKAAVAFLKAFFKSLLNPTPDAKGVITGGNIDAAVRAARNELFFQNAKRPQWAAPIVMRSTEDEPYIDYLAQPVTFAITPGMEMLLDIRATLWSGLADYSHAQGIPERLQGTFTALVDIESKLRTEAAKIGPSIIPQQATSPPGTSIDAVFRLKGALQITNVSGRVVVDGGITVNTLTLPPAMQADFQLVIDAQDHGSFELRSKSGAKHVVPEGEVLRARLDVGAAVASGLYKVAIEVQRLTPPTVLWPGHGVLIVPGP
jgi:hypothetical protein